MIRVLKHKEKINAYTVEDVKCLATLTCPVLPKIIINMLKVIKKLNVATLESSSSFLEKCAALVKTLTFCIWLIEMHSSTYTIIHVLHAMLNRRGLRMYNDVNHDQNVFISLPVEDR